MPDRIQRKRTKGFRMPADVVYVGRGSKWGNPVRAGIFKGFTAADAVENFTRWIDGDLGLRSYGKPPSCEEIKRELRGRNLACWCKPGEPCHADVLLEVANG